jgi:hypothetical protein
MAGRIERAAVDGVELSAAEGVASEAGQSETATRGGVTRQPDAGTWSAHHADTGAGVLRSQLQRTDSEGETPEIPAQLREQLEALGVKVPVFSEQTELTIRTDLDAADIHDGAVATWRDGSGKKQAAYTAEFHRRNAEKKWAKVESLEPRIDAIKAELRASALEGDQASMVAYIIAETGLRPGNQRSLQAGRYGVSTLRQEHVTVEDDLVRFSYNGKHDQPNEGVVRDAAFARVMRSYLADRHEGPVFDVDARAARETLPDGVKLKDLRTIVATRAARAQVEAWEGPPPPLTGDQSRDDRLIASALKTMSAAVADALNNTPAVARASYIHPQVFQDWVSGLAA